MQIEQKQSITYFKNLLKQSDVAFEQVFQAFFALDLISQGQLAREAQLPETLQLRLAQHENLYLPYCLAQNPYCAESVQTLLAKSSSTLVLYKLIKNPDLCFSAQKELAFHTNMLIMKGLAQRQHIDDRLCMLLLEDSRRAICIELAANPDISESVQLELSQDDNYLIRHTLARNSAITPLVQQRLIQNKGDLSTLACNPNLSLEIQYQLIELSTVEQFYGEEQSELLRLTLVRNSGITNEVKQLIADRQFDEASIYVALHDIHRQLDDQEQRKWAFSRFKKARQYLAHNLHLNQSTQLKLAKDRDDNVRYNLAQNVNISLAAQLVLVVSADSHACRKLAKNPIVSEDIQRKLAEMDIEYVKRKAVERRIIPSLHGWHNVLESLAGRQDLSEQLQHLLLKNEKYSVRCALAENPVIAKDVQSSLLTDWDNSVKSYLARNPVIDESIQWTLAMSKEREILYHLAKNPAVSKLEIQQCLLQEASQLLPEQQEKVDSGLFIQRGMASNLSLSEILQFQFTDVTDPMTKGILSENPSLVEAVQLKLGSPSFLWQPNVSERVIQAVLQLNSDNKFYMADSKS